MLMKDNIPVDETTANTTESPYRVVDEGTLIAALFLVARRLASASRDPDAGHADVDRLEAYWSGMRGLPIDVP